MTGQDRTFVFLTQPYKKEISEWLETRLLHRLGQCHVLHTSTAGWLKKPWSLQEGNVLSVYYSFQFSKSHTFLYLFLFLELRDFIICCSLKIGKVILVFRINMLVSQKWKCLRPSFWRTQAAAVVGMRQTVSREERRAQCLCHWSAQLWENCISHNGRLTKVVQKFW